jgi:hypothetical protein
MVDLSHFSKLAYAGVAVSDELRKQHAAVAAQIHYDMPANLLLAAGDDPRQARWKISELQALEAGQRKWMIRRIVVGAEVSIAFDGETVWRRGEFGAPHKLAVLFGYEPPNYYEAGWYRHCAELIGRNVPAYLIIHRAVNGDYFPSNVRRVPLSPDRHDYNRWMRLVESWAGRGQS